MAQMMDHRDLDISDESQSQTENRSDRAAGEGEGGSFRFNVSAPEFVPSVGQAPVPVSITGYFYPCFQYVDGAAAGNWMYVAADQEVAIPVVQSPKLATKAESEAAQSSPPQPQPQQQQQQNQAKEIILTEEIKAKIIKQAEYMFSDMSLLANETLVKHVNKDPEGFVSINFVSTLKKLKSLNISNQIVAQALRSSTKLVVSNDGKKVRRKQPFTDKEKEDLQLRTVIAENLPDDHSHQKIEKMFNVVGRVKAIRICQPQEHSSSRASKGDLVISNKLHALIEYENAKTAEKAAEKLNDEGNWRKGMRVRVMLKRPNKKSDSEEEDGPTHNSHEDTPRTNSTETSDADENPSVLRRSWSRNREKTKHHSRIQTARSLPSSPSHWTSSCPGQPVKRPRMPDGTRGFTMGRGKPVSIQMQAS